MEAKLFCEKNGLDTEDYCDVKMVSDWKLDLMAKAVMSEMWHNRTEDIEKIVELIKEYGTSTNRDNSAAVSKLEIEIEKLNNRLQNFVQMRADGEISKESFSSSKAKTEEEIAKLISERDKLKSESADDPEIDMELVKFSLEAMIDFSGDKLDTVMLDKFIAGVRAIDSSHFEWTVNVAPGKVSKVRCVDVGRKTSPTVEIITYDFYFFATENKSTY